MPFYNTIQHAHIELTERCNLSCPQCDRTQINGRVNKYLKNHEWSLFEFVNLISKEFITQLKSVTLCGNYGDPMMCDDLIPIINYIRSTNPTLFISLNVNGSSRSSQWWGQLARSLGHNSYVTFSIDGLEDTNKLYRIGSKWHTIMSSAQSFIDAGGRARWDYIVFSHNEHQVSEAEALSKQMGFEKFVVKKTGRFYNHAQDKPKDKHISTSKRGEVITLMKPQNTNYVNNSVKQEQDIAKHYGSMSKYYDTTCIECKSIKQASVYISAEGLVLPCCWVAGQLYKWYWQPKQAQIWQILNKDSVDLHHDNILQIVNNTTFNTIKQSWGLPSVADGKLKVCATKCGQEFDQFTDQYR